MSLKVKDLGLRMEQDQGVRAGKVNKAKFFLLFVLFLGSYTLNAIECEHDESSFRCVEFVRNFDGDTITVNIPGVHPLIGEGTRVRLRGVDTPGIRSESESVREMALEAKYFVHEKLRKAERIDLDNVGRDKYFRILANVIVDGSCLSSLLLKRGYAKEYSGRGPRPTFGDS